MSDTLDLFHQPPPIATVAEKRGPVGPEERIRERIEDLASNFIRETWRRDTFISSVERLIEDAIEADRSTGDPVDWESERRLTLLDVKWLIEQGYPPKFSARTTDPLASHIAARARKAGIRTNQRAKLALLMSDGVPRTGKAACREAFGKDRGWQRFSELRNMRLVRGMGKQTPDGELCIWNAECSPLS